MCEEEIYTFNEYILGYEKGNNDRSCLTISKIINDDMYVMSSLYDGSADVISMILDNLQKENQQLKEQLEQRDNIINKAREFIKSKEYVIDLSTFGYNLNDYDIFKLKSILNIDKGDD